MKRKPWIGQSVTRKEGLSKIQGRAKYVDDYSDENLIYGATIRSSVSRGKIRNIIFREGVPWDEITVVRASDIPGKNCISLILDDQPCLADKEVNHPEEPILLLGHSSKDILTKARTLVQIEYEELQPNLTLKESMSRKNIVWGKDNIFKNFLIQKGDVESQWAHAHKIVEGEYFTGAQEQLYIETNGMMAEVMASGGVRILGSMQCPYYVHKALTKLLGLPEDKVRIVQAETGGGFGGKEEYPSMIAAHAALLAIKSKKKAKIIYDRAEDLAATTKRHPSYTKHRTAVDKDGKILAMEIDFNLDGGAYATLSSVVLSRGTIHAAGPYKCDHVRIRAAAYATNTPPQGAFRGFGAPQSIFALERQLDKVAKAVGLAPEELRRRNFIKRGQTTATSQVIRDSVDQSKILAEAMKLSKFKEKKALFRRQNKKGHLKKGIGLATFFHGAGFTGSGEKKLASVVEAEARKDGKIYILASSTEIGQGTNTIFSQIAADALGVDTDLIEVVQPDTAEVPDSGPTVASRTTMVVGQLVFDACEKIKLRLIEEGLLSPKKTDSSSIKKALKTFVSKNGPLLTSSQYRQPDFVQWDDQTYFGDAYVTFAWACYVAEVTVNTLTSETVVDKFYAVQDIGKVVNPHLAEGQVEGGVAQGVGYAIYEKVVWDKGRMINNQMTNYIMPTSVDAPDIKVKFTSFPSEMGPRGAKGIGELPLDGTAPAILSAIENATGLFPTHIPFLPEDFFQLANERVGFN